MSASAISDGIITNLSAASVVGASQVATHWGVLETTGACAAVVIFRGLESTPWALGNRRERFYTHRATLYVKDRSGNATLLERDIQALTDKSVCSLELDRGLQGNPDIWEVSSITGEHDPTNTVEAGGAMWYFATLDIRTREWPGNS